MVWSSSMEFDDPIWAEYRRNGEHFVPDAKHFQDIKNLQHKRQYWMSFMNSSKDIDKSKDMKEQNMVVPKLVANLQETFLHWSHLPTTGIGGMPVSSPLSLQCDQAARVMENVGEPAEIVINDDTSFLLDAVYPEEDASVVTASCHFSLSDVGAAANVDMFEGGNEVVTGNNMLNSGWEISDLEDVEYYFRDDDSSFGQATPGTVPLGYATSLDEGHRNSSEDEYEESHSSRRQNEPYQQEQGNSLLYGREDQSLFQSTETYEASGNKQDPDSFEDALLGTLEVDDINQYVTQDDKQMQIAEKIRSIGVSDSSTESPRKRLHTLSAARNINTAENDCYAESGRTYPTVSAVDQLRDRFCGAYMQQHPKQQQDGSLNQHMLSSSWPPLNSSFVSKHDKKPQQSLNRQHSQKSARTIHSSTNETVTKSLTVKQESNAIVEVLPVDKVKIESERKDAGDLAELAVLNELEDIMAQLDIRTRLCIRDALYRLAASAMDRRKKVSKSVNTELSSEANDNEGGLRSAIIDMEKETNPLDRTIANLIFYKHIPDPTSSLCTAGMTLPMALDTWTSEQSASQKVQGQQMSSISIGSKNSHSVTESAMTTPSFKSRSKFTTEKIALGRYNQTGQQFYGNDVKIETCQQGYTNGASAAPKSLWDTSYIQTGIITGNLRA